MKTFLEKFLLAISILVIFQKAFCFTQEKETKPDKIIPVQIPIYDKSGSVYMLLNIMQGGLYGYYSVNREEIIVGNKYTQARASYEGLAAVAISSGSGATFLTKSDIWGFINDKGEEVVPCKYEEVSDFSEGIALVKLNGKWGVINKEGKEITLCKYENVKKISEGLIAAKLNGKWGFIDKSGKEVISFIYDNVDSFKDGWAGVVIKGEFTGFINKEGKKVFSLPSQYERVYLTFSDGLLCVKLKNGGWGYIDKSGKEVIQCKYEDATPFSEGLAFVKLNGKWGAINKQGQPVTQFKYDEAFEFSEGLAAVVIDKKLGYIDINGKEVVPHKYKYDFFSSVLLGVNLYFKDGFAYVCRDFEVIFGTKTLSNAEFFYIDKFGNEYRMPNPSELEKKYNSFLVLSALVPGEKPLAKVELNKKYGIINLVTSNEIIPIKYDDIKSAFLKLDDLIIVKLNNKWGCIDRNLSQVIPFKYDDIGYFSMSEGLAPAKLDNKWGYIDKTGKEVIPFIYDEAREFFLGSAEVKLNGVKGKIDKNGNPIITKYQENNKYGLKDSFGKIITEARYDEIRPFKSGYAAVRIDDLWGFINEKGELVFKPMFNEISERKDERYGDVYLLNWRGRWLPINFIVEKIREAKEGTSQSGDTTTQTESGGTTTRPPLRRR